MIDMECLICGEGVKTRDVKVAVAFDREHAKRCTAPTNIGAVTEGEAQLRARVEAVCREKVWETREVGDVVLVDDVLVALTNHADSAAAPTHRPDRDQTESEAEHG